jgi:hypothetical protein
MKTKYIFVTGGVLSSLGKGITAASIGTILKKCGYKLTSKNATLILMLMPVRLIRQSTARCLLPKTEPKLLD